MNYNEALQFIHGIARFGSKPGLKRVSMLLERMGNPQNKLRFVHVAGTNGKGSTCAMLASILKESGYKTGLYISPYVVDFCERIQLNGEMIPQEELAVSATLVKTHWDRLNENGEPPTEFEVVVAIAMDYFVRKSAEVIVLEVGMGGRFDATNVIKTPLCSVITSIGVDHTEYLGDTIEAIAAEKSGIIKPDGITVTSFGQPEGAMRVIEKTCGENNNKLLIPEAAEVISSDLRGSEIRYNGLALLVPFAGAHQVCNAETVVEAVKALRMQGLAITDKALHTGMAEAEFPARFEILCDKPLIILDGAHNPGGAKALAKTLDLLDGRRVHAIVGAMADKDVEGVLSEILPRCASVTVVAINNPRAMPVGALARLSMKFCDQVYIAGSNTAAIIQTLVHAAGDDALLVFGSLYLASDIRSIAGDVLARFRRSPAAKT